MGSLEVVDFTSWVDTLKETYCVCELPLVSLSIFVCHNFRVVTPARKK